MGGDELRQMVPPGVPVADCAGKNATRPTVDRLVADANHVLWFGHGVGGALVADQALIDLGNVGSLAGGVLVATACESAISLGPQAVITHGVERFLGFDDKIGWPVPAPGPTRDAFVGGLSCLFMQGHGIQCAAEQLKRNFHKARAVYEMRGPQLGLLPSDAQTAWLFAKSNAGSVRCLGDGAATLL